MNVALCEPRKCYGNVKCSYDQGLSTRRMHQWSVRWWISLLEGEEHFQGGGRQGKVGMRWNLVQGRQNGRSIGPRRGCQSYPPLLSNGAIYGPPWFCSSSGAGKDSKWPIGTAWAWPENEYTLNPRYPSDQFDTAIPMVAVEGKDWAAC